MKKIFISSTFQDLQLHRNQIWGVIQNFDVEVIGMETFGARKSKPLETCLKEIESCEIYIGIISMCYGSVDEETGKSYTQLEYDKAKELGLEILIYLLDEYRGEIKVGNIDFGDKNLRLNGFKNILKKNHTVEFFVNESDLSQKIYRDLEKKLSTNDTIIDRPKVLTSKVFRLKINDNILSIFIGYKAGRPYEIFSCPADDEDGILLPRNVDNGYIIQAIRENRIRYDFQFLNKRGYRTTVEGIDFYSDLQISRYSSIITKLLQSNTPLLVIYDVIQEMNFDEIDMNTWKEGMIKALSGKI